MIAPFLAEVAEGGHDFERTQASAEFSDRMPHFDAPFAVPSNC